jgi:hypothetical protein
MPTDAELREWATANGYAVGDGPIPPEVHMAYAAAHSSAPPAPSAPSGGETFTAWETPSFSGASGPPQVPPPGFDPSAPPAFGWAPTPPPRRHRGRTIALAVGIPVAVLVLLGVLAAVFINAGKHHLTAPASAAGHPRLDTGILSGATQTIKTGLAGQHVKHPVAAFYGTNGAPAFLLVGGDAGFLSSPSREVDQLIAGISSGASQGSPGAQVGAAQSFPAGKLGGVLKCGTLVVQTTHLSYCGFSDKSVVGAVMDFEAPAPADCALLTNRIRSELEK